MASMFADQGVTSQFTAKHTNRDPLYVGDIAGTSPKALAPFARMHNQVLDTSDIAGARPAKEHVRSRGFAPDNLDVADIAGTSARPWPVSGRNPVDPDYKLPSVTARWDTSTAGDAFLGVYRAPHVVRNAPVPRGQVRETNFVLSHTKPLYPGDARPPPEAVEGAHADARVLRERARRVQPPRDPANVEDINWRPEAGPFTQRRRPGWQPARPRDPLDPHYEFDLGLGGVGPVSTAAHVEPYARELLFYRTVATRPVKSLNADDIAGAAASTRGAFHRGAATRTRATDVSDIDGAQVGTRGDGFVLYRRPDYDALTGRTRVHYNAPGEPVPPTKTTNKLDDIEGTNAGSGGDGIKIYRPSHIDHRERTAALIANNGVPADVEAPFPRRNAHMDAWIRAAHERQAALRAEHAQRKSQADEDLRRRLDEARRRYFQGAGSGAGTGDGAASGSQEEGGGVHVPPLPLQDSSAEAEAAVRGTPSYGTSPRGPAPGSGPSLSGSPAVQRASPRNAGMMHPSPPHPPVGMPQSPPGSVYSPYDVTAAHSRVAQQAKMQEVEGVRALP
mmetsp:Transcript_22166/g.65329  ORF Transcript_22166/g.65329 Transcript_22166/m.65329 type:complete len:561 (+) Transcript_22166:79-1761(+)